MIDVLNESKYEVDGYTQYSLGDSDIDSYRTDNPKEAVKKFIKIAPKCPMETQIIARTKDDACELIDWCMNNMDEFISMMKNTRGFPYKIDYMVSEVQRQASNGCKYFVGMDNFGDAVDPFTVG